MILRGTDGIPCVVIEYATRPVGQGHVPQRRRRLAVEADRRRLWVSDACLPEQLKQREGRTVVLKLPGRGSRCYAPPTPGTSSTPVTLDTASRSTGWDQAAVDESGVEHDPQRAVADRPDFAGEPTLEQHRGRRTPDAFTAVVDEDERDCPVGVPGSGG
jgi:hypothetical protein